MTDLLPFLPVLDGLAAIVRDDRGPGGADEENTYGLPEGRSIFRELIRWFRLQRRIVLDWVPPAEDPLPANAPDLTRFDGVMGEAFTTVLTPYWDDAGQKTMAHLGLDPNEWKVEAPHLRAKIREAAYAFCHATNQTTSKQLETALRQLRAEFIAGQASRGETLDQLTQRVNGVFDLAEEWRARRIAATEASRATHAAQEEADIQSGVVAGLELLLSADACPLCRKVATECRAVRLGQPFAVIGHHPQYSTIKYPPIHPHCQCTAVEILLPQYGGPAHVAWGETLQQPQRGLEDGYTPPDGRHEPPPEPERGRERWD